MINQHYNELNVTTFGQQLSIVTGIDASVYTNRPIAKRLWINMDFVLNYQIKTCQFVYNILLGALHVYPNRAITFIHIHTNNPSCFFKNSYRLLRSY